MKNNVADDRDDVDRDELKRMLSALSPEERREFLEEVDEQDVYPMIGWAPNPSGLKSTLNFIDDRGTVTFEQLRQHLFDLDYTNREEGKYNFGIVSADDDHPIFETTGPRQADTEISLTTLGETIAGMFGDGDEHQSAERPLLFGLQPFGSAATYLSILDRHRDEGILRQDLEDRMVEAYGGSGSYFTGYYTSWYSRLGLLDKQQEGRKKRFYPMFPEGW